MTLGKLDEARLVPQDVILAGVGHGVIEYWMPADPVDGTAEYKEYFPVAWCCGHLITADGSASHPDQVRCNYNRRLGFRVWSHQPTEAETQAAEWEARDV